jgi:hypothetical protein
VLRISGVREVWTRERIRTVLRASLSKCVSCYGKCWINYRDKERSKHIYLNLVGNVLTKKRQREIKYLFCKERHLERSFSAFSYDRLHTIKQQHSPISP